MTLLSLEYPEEALRVAFRAPHVEGRHLQATALDYLESILPDRIIQLLWQVTGDQPVHGQLERQGRSSMI